MLLPLKSFRWSCRGDVPGETLIAQRAHNECVSHIPAVVCFSLNSTRCILHFLSWLVMVCSSSGKAGGAHPKMRQGPPQAEAAQQRLRVSAQLPVLDASALHSLPPV